MDRIVDVMGCATHEKVSEQFEAAIRLCARDPGRILIFGVYDTKPDDPDDISVVECFPVRGVDFGSFVINTIPGGPGKTAHASLAVPSPEDIEAGRSG